MTDQWKQIQRWAGVDADGVPGPATAAAIITKAGIAEVLPPAPAATVHALKDNAAFYQAVRKMTGSLDQVQVETIEAMLKEAAHWPIGFIAYGFATAWHEARLRPIEEIGKGAGRPYGKPGKYGQAQYGRGLVQLTWDSNYEWADRTLAAAGLITAGQLLKNFALALRPGIATMILIKGMETGAFTGKKLADYITDRGTHAAFVGSRWIINKQDRAEMIAGYADQFQDALDAGGWKS